MAFTLLVLGGLILLWWSNDWGPLQLAYRRGDHCYAVRLFSEVAPARPTDEDVQFGIGRAYLGLKQPKDGRAALDRAIELDPKAAFVPEGRKLLADNKAG